MAASSPTFVAIKLRPAAAQLPLGANAPSVALPLSFILTGLTVLSVGIVWLVANPDILATYHYNQNVIAATHLFVLGWICSIVMGAMYQLVPVALETRLYSERLAKWQFAVHVIGFVGMVWMFRAWNMKQVGHFGSVFTVSILIFVYNITLTLVRTSKWNVIATAITSALGWISFAVIAGLCIAAGKSIYESEDSVSTPSLQGLLIGGLHSVGKFTARFDTISAMHAHAHLGTIGFFTMLIVGVSYKLVPMFTISEIQSRRRAFASVVFLNVGLAGSFLSILLHSAWKTAFAFIVVGALGLYAWELAAILRARKRLPLDGGIKCFLTAIALLGLLAVIAVILSWPGLPMSVLTGQLENAYGFLGLLGFVTLAIIGMLYKIVPFLVWFGCYSRRIGRERVPALVEMYSNRLQVAGYWFHLAGLVVTTLAILISSPSGVRWGCGLLLLSVATLVLNTGAMLSHFFKSKTKAVIVPKTQTVESRIPTTFPNVQKVDLGQGCVGPNGR